MNRKGTLDERYFEWLYKKIGQVRNKNPARSFWLLSEQLFRTPFIWFVPNDDNRVAEGKMLRDEFMSELDPAERDPEWMELECSVLEMLIALGLQVADNSFGEGSDWFWRMIEHLNLRIYTDEVYDDGVREVVEETIQTVIQRTYERNGQGGLFPLKRARQDQRKIEIWYQMSAYLLENGDFGIV